MRINFSQTTTYFKAKTSIANDTQMHIHKATSSRITCTNGHKNKRKVNSANGVKSHSQKVPQSLTPASKAWNRYSAELLNLSPSNNRATKPFYRRWATHAPSCTPLWPRSISKSPNEKRLPCSKLQLGRGEWCAVQFRWEELVWVRSRCNSCPRSRGGGASCSPRPLRNLLCKMTDLWPSRLPCAEIADALRGVITCSVGRVVSIHRPSILVRCEENKGLLTRRGQEAAKNNGVRRVFFWIFSGICMEYFGREQ